MYHLAAYLLLLFASHATCSPEETEHRDFQYNSVVDPQTGRYNFAYDTGHDNDIAHSLHMQYRDANGMVRGRYGYTDPNGKLRMVEYEAGPNGFVARGDVGPDLLTHDQTPQTQVAQVARYTQEEDLQLNPRPVQMAGWDPVQDPIGQPVSYSSGDSSAQDENSVSAGSDSDSNGLGGYSTTNNTSNTDPHVYVPIIDPYNGRYPRISISTNENRRELEDLTAPTTENTNNAEAIQEAYPVAGPLTVNNIDVNPNSIRVVADTRAPVRRSADGGSSSRYTGSMPYSYRNYNRQTHDHDAERASQSAESGSSSRYTSSMPYSYRNYNRQTHDHDAETANQGTGYRMVLYRTPHGNHYHDRYYRRPTHDHEAERRRYVSNRQTHDHDAERRYYVSRQTHDHDAERRYYVNRQTHDHDAEVRNARNRQTHDHDAERLSYYRNSYYPYRRRIYYRDSHSMVPHEHYNDVYQNDSSHQHSDIHLYGRSQSLQYPATVRPRQLKYIPSDKYHGKYYYWTD